MEDRNTIFFSRKMKSNIARNKILSVITDAGERVTDYELMKEIAVQYYKNLFSSKIKVSIRDDLSYYL